MVTPGVRRWWFASSGLFPLLLLLQCAAPWASATSGLCGTIHPDGCTGGLDGAGCGAVIGAAVRACSSSGGGTVRLAAGVRGLRHHFFFNCFCVCVCVFFWTISKACLRALTPHTRCGVCSTSWPCSLNPYWCLQSDVMTDSRSSGFPARLGGARAWVERDRGWRRCAVVRPDPGHRP